MELKDFLEKVVDKSIFKETVKVQVPEIRDCTVCNGSGVLKIENTDLKVTCPNCRGEKQKKTRNKKVVEAKVLYVPIAFEENKERVFYVSIVYYENNNPINVSVGVEDLEIEDGTESDKWT